MKKNHVLKCLFTTLILLCFNINAQAQCPTLVWSDEFNGTQVDLTKWTFETGTGCDISLCGWGNNELQYYQSNNATISNGILSITAKKERVSGSSYTSARMKSLLKGDWTYGRFEARVKLPSGAGLWPAFWMLPTDNFYGTWPASGEIDIMESISKTPNTVLGTLHYGSSNTNHQYTSTNFSLNSGTFADAFHTFAIEWEAGKIRWFVDDILYKTVTTSDISPNSWPFDKRFFFIMNLAVGGNLGGTVDTSIFPQSMQIDYVRVYASNTATIGGPREVVNQATNVSYSVADAPSGSTFSWTVPTGATIASGQGTSTVKINFGSTSGNVTANVTSGCGTTVLNEYVYVQPPYFYEFSFANFDVSGYADLTSSTGTHSVVPNPLVSGVNTSALSAKYIRNSLEQYDIIVYKTSGIKDASNYTSKTKKFYIDIYTAAPIGTQLILQLENSAVATASNYPSGRHSRYIGTTTVQNQWQRIAFELLDVPDATTSNTSVDKIILLFASNSFTGDTYYYDNLNSYDVNAGIAQGSDTQSPTVPGNLASNSIAATYFNLSWTASIDNVGVTGYKVYVNGVLKGTTTQLNFTVTGLAKGSTNTVNLSAIDAAGNESVKAVLTVKTNRTGLKIASTTIEKEDISEGIVAYPNPVKDILNLKYLPTDSVVEVYDINGKLMTQCFLLKNDGSINLSGLSTGIYTLKINSNGAISSLKVLKK
ncbi:family 16 glycosylhydrolase [Flavobacterium sp.]|uniref:family 16 glycosylhydrolase n=1 Tax=Flavobacterium sp. TaxID=239 RepID=UPI0037501083